MATIRGTVKELIARKLSIGGVAVDGPTLYSLGRIGIARKVSEQKAANAKRPAAVWELDTEIKLNLTAADV